MEVLMTYPLSFETQIFHNGQQSQDRKTFEEEPLVQ
jgi:hypothetical protein